MGAVLPAKLREMSKATDPREGIRKALGAVLNEISIRGQQILVATYIEPDKTAGGIWKPDSTIQESLWMGTTGMVVKKGPWAFLPEKWPDHDSVEVGDWVIFKFSSAWEFHLNGVSVRLVDDIDVKAVVSSPALLTSKPHIVLE